MNKTYNINAMRPALVAAHNDNNRKAIDRQRVADTGVSLDYFNAYLKDVKSLQNACVDYVRLVKEQRTNDKITDKQIKAKRDRIFPLWKTLLECGEKDKLHKELHITEFDVDSLSTFSYQFVQSSKGTVEAETSEKLFRKNVEALLGCIIAKNTMLNDKERETLDSYYKAVRKIEQYNNRLDEIKGEIESFNKMKSLAEQKNEQNFVTFLQTQINNATDERAKIKESITDTKQKLAKVEGDAKSIERKLKTIK